MSQVPTQLHIFVAHSLGFCYLVYVKSFKIQIDVNGQYTDLGMHR